MTELPESNFCAGISAVRYRPQTPRRVVGAVQDPAPTSPHPRGAPEEELPRQTPAAQTPSPRRLGVPTIPSLRPKQKPAAYIMSREGSPTREVTPSSGLRGSMDSLFSKASSSIQSAAQSAAQAVQDTAQSVARSPRGGARHERKTQQKNRRPSSRLLHKRGGPASFRPNRTLREP